MNRPNVVIDLSEKQNAHLVNLWNRGVHAYRGLLLAQLDPSCGKMKVAAFSFAELVGTLRGFERTGGGVLSLANTKDGEEV